MFDSIMWEYMRAEKQLLSSLIVNSNVKKEVEEVNGVKAIYLVAHGSSYNASTAIAPFITRLSGIRTYAYTPSNFVNNAYSLLQEEKETTWVLGISQTGTSRGVLEAIEYAKNQGYKIIGVTNEKGSPLDKISNVSFYLECGEENSNAKTKGYSSTLLTLMILGIELSKIPVAEKDAIYNELQRQIDSLDEVIEKTIDWCNKKSFGKDMKNIYVIGNGMNFATAMEGQLKLMETQCIPTMFNDIEELSHGMHRAFDSDSCVMLLNSQIDCDLMLKTMKYLKSKGVKVVMINAEEPIQDEDVINVGSYDNTSSILVITSAIQAISAFVPEMNGKDPNRNANNDYTDLMETRV